MIVKVAKVKKMIDGGNAGEEIKMWIDVLVYGRGFYDVVRLTSDTMRKLSQLEVDFVINYHPQSDHMRDVRVTL